MPDGGLALDDDILLVVIDLEGGFEGIIDLPDDDGGYLDWIAHFVVDFELLSAQVAGAKAQFLLDEKRVRPVEAILPDRSSIAAEEYGYLSFIGIDDEKTPEYQQCNQKKYDICIGRAVASGGVINDAAGHREQSNAHGKHQVPGQNPGRFFCHKIPPSFINNLMIIMSDDPRHERYLPDQIGHCEADRYGYHCQ